MRAVLLTLSILAAIAFLTATDTLMLPYQVIARYTVLFLLTAVIYSGFTGGMRAGIISAVLCTIYYAVLLSMPGRIFSYSRPNLAGLIIVAIALVAIGATIGLLRERVNRLIEREREARRDAEATADWSAFLADAGRELSSSLDYDATLRSVAQLAVPRIADLCTVYCPPDGGRPHRSEMAALSPEKEELLEEYRRRNPIPADARHSILEALRTGRPRLIREVSESAVAAIAENADHREVLLELGITSAIMVPLVARGHTLGAINFVSTEPGHRYDDEDLQQAIELANRAALAIDNARLYHDAEEANRAKSDFLAVMSHELRTPLNAIIGYADLMLMDVNTRISDQVRHQVRRIMSSANHLLELIEEVLTFSRTEAGEENVRPEPTDIRDVVREVVHQIRPQAQGKGLEFHVLAPGSADSIMTDPDKLQRILINLLSNAIKFTAEGEIALEAMVADEQAVFRVRDTGVGIAPENVEGIFEPFSQIEHGTTRTAGGTGLGLPVARRLARLLGGDVRVRSEPGKGSTFILQIAAHHQRKAA